MLTDIVSNTFPTRKVLETISVNQKLITKPKNTKISTDLNRLNIKICGQNKLNRVVI